MHEYEFACVHNARMTYTEVTYFTDVGGVLIST